MTAGNDRTIQLWNPHRVGESAEEGLHIQTYEGQHNYAVHDIVMCVSTGFVTIAS